MEGITLFKVAQFIILLSFVILVSDIRNKRGMVPLINGKLTLSMRFCYPILSCGCGFVIATMNSLLPLDFAALAMTLLGTSLMVKAKRTLGEYHTWAGYHFKATKLMTEGIYAFIRHPMYTGVYIFILGGLLICIPNLGVISTRILYTPWFVTYIGLTALVYMMALIPIIASRETAHLQQQFGDEFLEYQQQVHAFLPLRKFKG
jgi:protein-S-isoprenylcysteine O-methyltransferase Ste14